MKTTAISIPANRASGRAWDMRWPAESLPVATMEPEGFQRLNLAESPQGLSLSRFWQPPSQSSAGDGAVSFGLTMASNMGFSIVKEFLPDLGRAISKKHHDEKHAPPVTSLSGRASPRATSLAGK